MSKKNPTIRENIRLGKLVHGGQAIAEVPSGKKIFVWAGLPGELVNVQITKKKGSYLEGVVTEVLEPSDDRVEPVEPVSYLSTSPWQIMSFKAENIAKQDILVEAYEREKVTIPEWSPFVALGKAGRPAPLGVGLSDRPTENPPGVFHYRNKMEIGFWGDDDGLHLANYVRGTHGKQIVTSNALASEEINSVAQKIALALNEYSKKLEFRAGDLKLSFFGALGQVKSLPHYL